jgi:hypothetical protein
LVQEPTPARQSGRAERWVSTLLTHCRFLSNGFIVFHSCLCKPKI